MKILVTGFDPFGNEKINPAFETINRLNDLIDGAQIIKLQVPTVFNKSIKVVTEKIAEEKPDVVLCLGQASGRYTVTVERVAINIDDARIPDNENNQPVDSLIDPDGEPAYFSTIPIKKIVNDMKMNKIPVEVSNTAGTFVCNHLLYGVLSYIYKNKLNTKAGFIHIPLLPEQVVDKPNTPSMDLNMIVNAINIAIKTIVKEYR
ncbi:pyroglutamyl-peptidase I [Clostridium sp. cel8]|jgi:pyroglutamyl-peptidase|uniref:pyroglutamyl-peptidase I n=1 Tax=Clostridium sp. cel8 TaxID=2663123 RepID=UPI0015F695B3|nr:pyroglutamyl-peptidase I [Clostridium sp. cel8]MBA5851209.1 pyroglutamyl-peptidase I [Clostridium sp. cel8]